MDVFPAYFPLAGRRMVVAGTGEAAEAKLRLFDGSPANIVRLQGPEALLSERYAGATLAFIADPDEGFAAAAAAAARTAGVLVNVTDRPALCDFTTPAIIDRGEVVAAVGTGGSSPMLAGLLRSDIEQRIPEGVGRVAALMRQFQEQIRTRFPLLHARRAFLRDALSGPAARAAQAGDMEEARRFFVQAIADGSEPIGCVQVLSGLGPADLLTLRAARALAAADIVIADVGSDPAILDFARRDAERKRPEAVSVEQMADLARSGRRVVRVVMNRSDEAPRLSGIGIVVEIINSGTEA